MEVFFFRVINFARCTPISNCHDCSGRGELKIGDVLNHSGAPNDDLPLNTLRTLLRLPRVLLDL